MHIIVRFFRINLSLWGLLFFLAMKRWRGTKKEDAGPAKVASTLESLGATFIKLGQALGLHSELLPPEYVVALQRLQDHVGPCEYEYIIKEVERSFGLRRDELFEYFEPVPLGGGSIAQVHKAILKDGREIIVKVRRPDIKRQIQEDIRILRWFLKSLMLLFPRLKQFRPLDLVEELSTNLHKEIDFRQEAFSIMKFVRAFEGQDSIYIPNVVDRYYTEWVIFQEMSHGCRLDEHKIDNRTKPVLADKIVEAFLYQCLVSGTFHGDPHPGNVFVLPDGRLCFHDFGLTGHLDRNARFHLLGVMGSFTNADSEWLLDSCIGLGLLTPNLNRAEFLPKLEELIEDYSQLALKDWSLSAALLRIARMGGGKNARLPHHIATFIRAMFLVESTLRELDPGFNLVERLFSKAPDVVKKMSLKEKRNEIFSRTGLQAIKELEDIPTTIAHFIGGLRENGLQVTVKEKTSLPAGADVLKIFAISRSMIALGLYVSAGIILTSGLTSDVPSRVTGGIVFLTALTISVKAMKQKF